MLLHLLFLFLLPTALTLSASDKRAHPSDVKYIRCETCTRVAQSATKAINDLESSKLTQLSTLDAVESLCTPSTTHGRWMRQTDLVERLGKLKLISQEGQQECLRECKTMALACEDVLDGVETELAERLYAVRKEGDVKVAEVEKFLCARRGGLSTACAKAPPRLPRDRPPGPSFEPKSKKDADMENLMEQIQMAGGGDMNMNMMNREQMMAGMGGMGGTGEDDDDDDDDDEEEPPEGGDEEGGADEDEEDLSIDDTSLGEPDDGLRFEEQTGTVGEAAKTAAGVDAGSDEL